MTDATYLWFVPGAYSKSIEADPPDAAALPTTRGGLPVDGLTWFVSMISTSEVSELGPTATVAVAVPAVASASMSVIARLTPLVTLRSMSSVIAPV